MEIVIGSDHGGFELKEKLKEWLAGEGHSVEDVGCTGEKCDYPDFGAAVAKKVAGQTEKIGIAICGTGIGICMAANKVKGVRAAMIYDEFTAKMAREHNNANVVCLGGRTIDEGKAKEIVGVFLSAKFEGGRHLKRVQKIADLE